MKSRTDPARASRRRAALACAAVLAVSGVVHAVAQEPASARLTVETLHRALVAAAAHDQVDARFRALEPIVVETHDLAYIAEFALRRQWPMLSEADRERFVAAFTKLSVMTYASRFANVTAGTFAITAAEPAASGRATVTAAVGRANGEPVTLEYLLHESDGRFRIINIVADGVSDLALKRAEYQAALAAGTLDDLIGRLESQAQDLADGAAR
jgi:phospholipid transport system substrate-binding protein